MILVDWSNVSIACYLYAHGNIQKNPDESIVLPVILSAFLDYKKKFLGHGDIALCVDSGETWRKDYFPLYKAKRKEKRDSDNFVDWNHLFEVNRNVYEDLIAHMPFYGLKVPKTEADDIIAVMAKYLHPTEKVMIVASDKDFKQLQKFPNVRQYSTYTKDYLVEQDPDRFLLEHIIRGDGGDGIPNIKSPDNAFVDGIRQKSIFQKELDVWLNDTSLSFLTDDEMKARYQRNNKLINFNHIPQEIQDTILDHYQSYELGSKNIYKYFVARRLTNFMENIQEFSRK